MNKNKALIIGDIHAGISKNSKIFHETLLQYGDWIKRLATDRNITRLIFLGDIFDNRVNISLDTLNCVSQFFEKLTEYTIDITPGNHDCLLNDNASINSLAPFKNHPNIRVHDNITMDNDIVYAGWGVKLDDIPNCRLFFGHIDVVGYELTKGKISQHGFRGKDLMDKVSGAVYTGHYHHPQTRNYNGKPLCYTGSAFALNFNDAGDQKFIYELDLDTLEVEKIPNTISPKFYYITDIKDYDKIQGNFVSIKVPAGDEGIKILTDIQTYNPLHVKTAICEQPHFQSSPEVNSFKLVKIDDTIREYIMGMDTIDDDQKNQVVSMLNDLYHKHQVVQD